MSGLQDDLDVQKIQIELNNLEPQKQALEQDIFERPWSGVSLDPREKDWIRLQNTYINLRGKLRYALDKKYHKEALREWLLDLDNRIDTLEQEIRDYPWGDPRRKEWLADYEEQRHMAEADYALLQRKF